MLSRARRGACEIVAGAALWRCRCEIVAGAALWRCRCRSRGRRSILCIWVCVCVAGVAFGSCLEGQDVVARAAGGVRNRGRRSTLAMPLRNRGSRSTLAMPLPKSWQPQHSVHLGVCLCGRGRIRQLSRGTGCCRARGGGRAKSWQAQHFGDAVAEVVAAVISTAQMYSTSRLPYHLRVKGIVGTQVLVQKLESLPWSGVPAHHPLVPLQSLARVKDRQQICVAAQVDDNPGAIERDTVQGRVLVCNAIVQQNGVRARCAFWREHAEKLATCQAGTCILLYQVLVEKKKEGSWEIGSWRGTQILECPEELAKNIGERIMEPGDCRMLTLIPTRNWKECEAVQSTLSALVGTIVPGSCGRALWRPGPSAIRHRSRPCEVPSCRGGAVYCGW